MNELGNQQNIAKQEHVINICEQLYEEHHEFCQTGDEHRWVKLAEKLLELQLIFTQHDLKLYNLLLTILNRCSNLFRVRREKQ